MSMSCALSAVRKICEKLRTGRIGELQDLLQDSAPGSFILQQRAPAIVRSGATLHPAFRLHMVEDAH